MTRDYLPRGERRGADWEGAGGWREAPPGRWSVPGARGVARVWLGSEQWFGLERRLGVAALFVPLGLRDRRRRGGDGPAPAPEHPHERDDQAHDAGDDQDHPDELQVNARGRVADGKP